MILSYCKSEQATEQAGPWATSLQVVTGESDEQCQARFAEERREKVRDETASIIQTRFEAAQRKIHESDVALEREIRAAADSFVGVNGNAAKRDKLLSDNQSESRVAIELTILEEHNAVVQVWRTAFPDRFKQVRSDPDGWRMKAPDANEPQDLHPSMEQWDGKFRNFQQEVKKQEEERWRDKKRRSFWDPLRTSAKNGGAPEVWVCAYASHSPHGVPLWWGCRSRGGLPGRRRYRRGMRRDWW